MDVIHDHDAHVDDLLALSMLLASPKVRLRATTVCPGDCFRAPGLKATRRFLEHFGRRATPTAAGTDEGINPFPALWRRDSYRLEKLSELKTTGGREPKGGNGDAASLLARLLSFPRRTRVLITGPATNLAAALALEPSVRRNIERVWIMGGAVRVPGNVARKGHDGSAEWNFFNHPLAADGLLRSGVPITLVSLDATNHAPVTRGFLDRLRAQSGFGLSRLALQTWNVALRHIENPVYAERYYFWDTLAAGALLQPPLLRTKRMRVRVVTEGKSRGRTVESADGHWVDVGVGVDRPALERLILRLFRR